MKRPTVLLVNPNRMRPLIGPIGLEYIAASLFRTGYESVLCDLAFTENWKETLGESITDSKPFAVGVSIRNIDDAYFASQDFILEKTTRIIREIMALTDAPVILGGIGFSVAPTEVLEFTGAPYGIAGDGEESLPILLDRLAKGAEVQDIPGIVFRSSSGKVVRHALASCEARDLPAPSRRLAENSRYFSEGGQAGLETKKGCPCSCIYCIEPEARGRTVKLRSPESVADEFADFVDQGIDVFHLCDSEFNQPVDHAYAVCDALIRRGIADQIRWYTYASPNPFNDELAQAMKRAGCVGINFGVDHGDETMLRRLGRNYGPDEIRKTAEACRRAGFALMFDLLLGGPGENQQTILRTLDFMRELKPDRVGLSCGVRIYPYTPLARAVRDQGPLEGNPNLHGNVHDNENLLRPIFYVDSGVGEDIHRYVWSQVGDDNRFLAADPEQIERNYNYNDNPILEKAIRNGARGAYWDILRKRGPAPEGME